MTKMAPMPIYGKNILKMTNFSIFAFIWENVTMMDSLEIIASRDLEFGKYSNQNE